MSFSAIGETSSSLSMVRRGATSRKGSFRLPATGYRPECSRLALRVPPPHGCASIDTLPTGRVLRYYQAMWILRTTDRYTLGMTPIALRLPAEIVAELDQLVASGAYRTRTDLIRTALEALLHEHRERTIDEQIVAGYRRNPVTEEEMAMATAATRALIADEPW